MASTTPSARSSLSEYGALLDMELDIGEGAGVDEAAVNSAGSRPNREWRGDAGAARSVRREGCRVQLADQREATEKRLGEAHAFLFREADDFDRKGKPCR